MRKWPVLHDKPTTTSLHRSVHAPSYCPPTDSLDIHLLSCYQHNQEIFSERSDIMRHPSRLESTIYRQGNAVSEVRGPSPSIIQGGVQARPSIHSVKLGIGSNHIAQTIAGFSRKIDGTFYNL